MKYRFLCVDDEKRCLSTLTRLCYEQNPANEVTPFDDPEEALLFAQSHTFDVALLDVDMPIMNGIDLAKELLKINEKLNIILVTAYAEYAIDAFSINCSGYLLKPCTMEMLEQQLAVLRYPVTEQSEKIELQCFGNFEAFYQGTPLIFNYAKTKELLAYLVDRKGAICSNAQLCAALWEDEDNHSEYLKKLKSDLVATLEKYDQGNVLTKLHGGIALNKSTVSCDYYDFLDKKNNSFRGEYMEAYFWAEITKSSLTGNLL